MRGRMHLFVHPAIERGEDALAAARRLGMAYTEVPERPVEGWLGEAESKILESGERPALFVSLPIANAVLRHHPGLARGLAFSREFLKPSCYSSYLPEERLLNPRAIFLPWGHLPRMAAPLADLFPEGLFLRPDSGMKSFTGFDVSHDQLLAEWSSRGQIHAMQPEEMVQVAPRKTLSEIEYRVWIVDTRPVTAAAYGWRDLASSERRVPDPVFEAAADVGRFLALRQQEYTADFALVDGIPKLVEINALSTSGWYPGVDLEALFASADEVFL